MPSYHSGPRRAVALLAALALAACSNSQGPTTPSESDIAAARESAAALGGALKTRLLDAIAQGGPVSGIAVCSEAAPGIASLVSQEKGLTVGRTALRVRNPANAPDAWERQQLEDFLVAIKDGVDPARLEYSEVVVTGKQKTFRWMKPIMMDGPCQLCHGEAIAEDVRAAILAQYPEDKATGFRFGEMRGAFTVEKPISDDQ